MKKLTSALAVAALVAAPAMASAQGPQVYGQIHTSLELQDNGDDSGVNVISRASRLGVRGGAPLDVGNMMVVYQVESELNTAAGGGTLAHRDTYVGLRGDFGMLRIGRMVPPSTVLRARADLFSDQIGDARNGMADQTAFDLRVGNSIAYAIQFGGVGLDLFYTTTGGAPTTETDENLLGIGLNYADGPLWVGLTYEHHGETFLTKGLSQTEREDIAEGYEKALGLPAGSLAWQDMPERAGSYGDSSSIRLGASYAMGNLRIAGMFEHADWDSGDNYEGIDDTSMSFGGGVAYSIDRVTLKAQAYMTTWDDAEDADHTMVALGADYALSDATTAYAAFAMTMNDDKVDRTPYNAGAISTIGNAKAGEDAMAFGVGLIHRF